MSSEPKRIVILGGGFAGMTLARRLERRVRPDEALVTLVSRDNYLLFTPMLPEVSSGGLEARHVVTPLRTELRRTRFVLAEATRIDFERRAVEVRYELSAAPERLPYDHLVLALGSVTSTFAIPGVAEHSFAFKRLEDAELLRNHVIATLELASAEANPSVRKRLLTYAVIGGGYTGVEVAGELVDFFRSACRFYPNVAAREIAIVLIEGGKRLLPDLNERMGAYVAAFLESRGVRVSLGDLVTRVEATGVDLRSGARIEAATIVWSAGVRPSPLVAGLPLPHARNGAILARADMSIDGFPGVWALGDCAWIPDAKGGFYPATAQHAIREGPALADNLVAALRGQPAKPFVWEALGTMASLGGRRGVVGFPNGFVLAGFPAWVLWRTYYLWRIPGAYRKARVAFDWFIGLLFPRDVAELRVETEPAQRSALADAGLMHHPVAPAEPVTEPSPRP